MLLGVGITFSCIALIFNALAKGYDFFTYYFTLFLTPMMFLSGIFFPLEQLPPLVRIVATRTPLERGGWCARCSWTSWPDAVARPLLVRIWRSRSPVLERWR